LTTLQEALEERKKRNPRYSLRAFAKAIGVDNATLSRILNERSIPSQESAIAIAEELGLDNESRYHFLKSLEKARRQDRLTDLPDSLQYQNIRFSPEDEVSLATIAVGELVASGLATTIPEICYMSGLPEYEVEEVVSQLIKFGSLRKVDGKISHTFRNTYFYAGDRPPG